MKGSQKIQHAIYVLRSASVNGPLPCFTEDVSELVVEPNALPHTVDYRVDCKEGADQPRTQILWQR